ncbi:short-chain dehydrogenase/reductase SDR [Enterobacter soli]|nr:short-chain dehydrogenase/reductase SDR [Enterobacter soli]
MNNEKVALIFGGARGIGAAIAAWLAREGYRIAITWVSRPDRADPVATHWATGGDRLACHMACQRGIWLYDGREFDD